jgi:hypothetical protein
MKILLALAAALVAASTIASQGQTLNYSLTGSSSLLSTGATRTYSSNGVTMTAAAWSYTRGSSNNSFEASRLGRYTSGLGVTNNEEDGSAPGHRVDNFEQNDYILFTFDSLVNVTSIQIASIVDDSDVSYWVGNINSPNISGVTYSGLGARGFQGEVIDQINANISSRSVSISSPASGVNAILFGAERGLDSGHYLDQFKVAHLKATVVPEPSAALLSVLGALGFSFRRRR